MEPQPDGEADNNSPPAVQDCEDSEDESSQEEPPTTSWSELSIIERVGLNSVEMSERDLESAFTQIALAFRCDQYTLKQRLQAEEHARNLAEENIQLELSRGRETLETLKGLCLDSKRSKILQRLELSLDILAGTVERISNTAEVLGAVHQEARVSRAVELMVAHVENLRIRHERQAAELEEAKNNRNYVDPRDSPDPEESERKRIAQQSNSRRRVSVTLIPAKSQEKMRRKLKKGISHGGFPSLSPTSQDAESSCAMTKDDSCLADVRPMDPDETPSEGSAPSPLPLLLPPPPPPPLEPAPNPSPKCLPSKQQTTKKIQSKTDPVETLRQRHKGKTVLPKKKADKDKKTVNIYRRITGRQSRSMWRQRPLAQWLYRCRWPILCMYLMVLCFVVTFIYFLFEAL